MTKTLSLDATNVLDFLRKIGEISGFDAREAFDIRKLAPVINELRDVGFEIARMHNDKDGFLYVFSDRQFAQFSPLFPPRRPQCDPCCRNCETPDGMYFDFDVMYGVLVEHTDTEEDALNGLADFMAAQVAHNAKESA